MNGIKASSTIFFLTLLAIAAPAAAQSSSSAYEALSRARFHVSAGRLTRALEEFDNALTVQPNDGLLHCESGWVAYRAGELALARRRVELGITLLEVTANRRPLGACLYTRGRIAEDQGRARDALRDYRRSLVERPGNSAVTEHLARLQVSLEQPGAAADSGSASGSRLAVHSVLASSYTGRSQGRGTYHPANLVDGDRSTGWQVSNAGAGQWARLELGERRTVTSLGIIPGYDKYRPDRYGDRFPLNNRVRRIRIEWDGGSREAVLADSRAMQFIDLGDVRTAWIIVRILDIYPGSRWNDTVISELQVMGEPEGPAVAPTVVAAEETPSDGPSAETASQSAEVAATPNRPTSTEAAEGGGFGFSLMVIGGSSVSFFLVALVASLFLARRRRREETTYLRRARQAHRAVHAEVQGLGQAFDHVLAASDELWERAQRTVAHVGSTRAAIRRTGRLASQGASERRQELAGQEETALQSLEMIAERLEETAVQLAAQQAGQAESKDVERLVERLNLELETAVTADEEARAVLEGEAASSALVSTPKRVRRSEGQGRSFTLSSTALLLVCLGSVVVAAAIGGAVAWGSEDESAIASTFVPEGAAVGFERGEGSISGAWSVIPAGDFTMGRSGDHYGVVEEHTNPILRSHEVELRRSFLMQRTEVTQGSFLELMGYNPSRYAGCGLSCPVERVTWHEAAAYCNALSQREERETCYRCEGEGVSTRCTIRGRIEECLGYRLPTEAEWEYAARGEHQPSEDGSTELQEVAWYSANSGANYEGAWGFEGSSSGPQSAGQLPANAHGLRDMLGNVWEWTNDYYGLYPTSRVVDPTGPYTGRDRVVRGGSWFSSRWLVSLTNRAPTHPTLRFDTVGFRVVRTLPVR